MQSSTVAREAPIGSRLEGLDVHEDSAPSTPCERARAGVDQCVQPRPAFPQMVQLAAEIGQGLGVARFRPQGAADALTRDSAAAGMKDEKGNELLLAKAW